MFLSISFLRRWPVLRPAAFSFFLALTGCEKTPLNHLSDPLPDGAVPQISGLYTIFDEELKTGGGVSFIPGGDNQSLDFRATPGYESDFALRYAWNGQDVSGQHLFAGFVLPITPDISTALSATPKELSAPGYTKLTLRIKGSLSAHTIVRIEGPGDGTSIPARVDISSLSSTWSTVTLSVPSADFSDVRFFMTVSLQYTQAPRTTNPGEGGEIYLDAIRYEQ